VSSTPCFDSIVGDVIDLLNQSRLPDDPEDANPDDLEVADPRYFIVDVLWRKILNFDQAFGLYRELRLRGIKQIELNKEADALYERDGLTFERVDLVDHLRDAAREPIYEALAEQFNLEGYAISERRTQQKLKAHFRRKAAQAA
jgi:hypothetical protein